MWGLLIISNEEFGRGLQDLNDIDQQVEKDHGFLKVLNFHASKLVKTQCDNENGAHRKHYLYGCYHHKGSAIIHFNYLITNI